MLTKGLTKLEAQADDLRPAVAKATRARAKSERAAKR